MLKQEILIYKSHSESGEFLRLYVLIPEDDEEECFKRLLIEAADTADGPSKISVAIANYDIRGILAIILRAQMLMEKLPIGHKDKLEATLDESFTNYLAHAPKAKKLRRSQDFV